MKTPEHDHPQEHATVSLRATIGAPLDDEDIRRMVVATAQAIAERTGVPILELTTEGDRITVTLHTSRLGAVGFAAELRRLTQTWYARKFGGELWGPDPDPQAEESW